MEVNYAWTMVGGLAQLTVTDMGMARVYDKETIEEQIKYWEDKVKRYDTEINRQYLKRYRDGLKLFEGVE